MKSKLIKKHIKPLIITAASAFALAGCNADGVSSVLNAAQQMQAAQANNLAPSQQQIVNASAMLDGMDERSKTRLLQTQMNTMGYSVGTADGVAGPATRRALQNFQRDYGLNVSGRFDADTIDVLMLNMLADQQTTAAPTTTQQPSNTALLLLQQQLQQRTGGTVNNQPGVSNEAQTLLNLMNSLPK